MLYFVYTARLAPDDLRAVAPSATFEFVAHLAEATLSFSVEGNGWKGGLPTVVPDPDSTVWGAVFSVPDTEADALDRVEATEERIREETDVIDRSGRRHPVVIHRTTGPTGPELVPAPAYLDRMLSGSRHWELPIGWIVGLDDRRNAVV
ncbi:MAG: gamma-glutamylcyclotransferase family protein [Acidimicrobiia bacterium]